ncbi:MAG: S-methyl-5-thioribose-1-phosphate isomerase [Infirmifilum sp.]|jgi:methylthioribose-1-phosphate isomerase|uniref:Putative methylthioribose-1-phosphate isomerase n=1 Tax=Infirmifilum uzonense TaxID=1550241 RepID=A0A0F7CKP9_9CREN|nr:S-methyl-5-thioribose-1-phosphate isomerase [Infirmifilum uzonense]AKG38041.1 methylthioribose-1-phosphate isomerase [Infirmifilum uzonense]
MLRLPRTIEWKDGIVRLINQKELPDRLIYIETSDWRRVAKAIKDMEIRGAPAIGVAAGYALALFAYHWRGESLESFKRELFQAAEEVKKTRPTAVNLFWAVERILSKASQVSSIDEARRSIIEEAINIHKEDERANRRIGEIGAELIEDGDTIITVCNAGSLATSYWGTATAPMYVAREQGKNIRVIALETRPYLQGARLTAWELSQAGIDVVIATDNSIGILAMREKISLAIVGADRVTRIGWVANKLGTYPLALVSRVHNIPFYVAAPTSTLDLKSKDPTDFEIEKRDPSEVLYWKGTRIAPEGVNAIYYAFDLTPPQLITGIITEAGIIYPPYEKNIPRTLQRV